MAFIRCRRRRHRHAAQNFHYLYSINLAIRKVICPSAAVLVVQKHAVQRCPSTGLGFQFKLCQTFRLNPGISAQF